MQTRDSNEVVAVGWVPDELLLLCGRPGSVPSAWWTPVLARHDEDEAARLVEVAAQVLDDASLRAEDGMPGGMLGEVAAVVADARVVLLFEGVGPDGVAARRSVVAGEHRALLDVQDRATGLHDLLLCGPRATVALVAELLRPTAPPSRTVRELAGRRSPDEVAAMLPAGERHTTLRLSRARLGSEPTVHHATVVHHPAGAVVAWAAPGGLLEVEPLDEDGAVALAGVLLGAEAPSVARTTGDGGAAA